MSNTSEFLIEGILPAHEVHLFGGSSGSGKTTLLFQILSDWQRGNDVLGHKSFPVPYAYLSLDRSRSSVQRTLQRIQLDDQIDRIVTREKFPGVINPKIMFDIGLSAYPDSQAFFVEGYQTLAGDRGNSYAPVAHLLTTSAMICASRKLTLLGVAHASKLKQDERWQNSREVILGSVAWSAYSDTIIVLDNNEETKVVTCRIMPRNAPSEQHEFMFGDRGILQPYIPRSKKDSIALKIAALPAGRPLTKGEVTAWGKQMQVSTRTCEAAIKTCLENNLLEVIGTGIYERTSVCLTEFPSDPDIIVE